MAQSASGVKPPGFAKSPAWTLQLDRSGDAVLSDDLNYLEWLMRFGVQIIG